MRFWGDTEEFIIHLRLICSDLCMCRMTLLAILWVKNRVILYCSVYRALPIIKSHNFQRNSNLANNVGGRGGGGANYHGYEELYFTEESKRGTFVP
jgi:hypothetical protein